LQWVQVWENGTSVAVPAYSLPLPPETYFPLLAAVAMFLFYLYAAWRWQLFDPWRGDYFYNAVLAIIYIFAGLLLLSTPYVYITLNCSGVEFTAVVANPYAASGYVPLVLGILSLVLAVAQALGELVE